MSSTKKIILITIILNLVFVISGCSFSPAPPTETPTQGPDLTVTHAVETAYVELTEQAHILALSATLTPSITPTHTQTPTFTPTFTYTPSITPTATETGIPTQTATALPNFGIPEDAIVAYFVIVGSGGPVGCGDNLIPVRTGQYRTGNVEEDLKVALNYLFSAGEYIIGLYNATHASSLKAGDVDFNPGTGKTHAGLTGTYVPPVTKCDAYRYREQVWQTAYQFDEITSFTPLLGGALLGDRLYSVMLNGADE